MLLRITHFFRLRKLNSIAITSENTLGDTSSSRGFRPIGEYPWFHVGAEHLSDSQWCIVSESEIGWLLCSRLLHSKGVVSYSSASY